jgi:hypothetical protein
MIILFGIRLSFCSNFKMTIKSIWHKLLLAALAFVTILQLTYADLNKDRSFIKISNPIPCVRRFNTTHQIGCAKLDYDDYDGVVYAVRNQSEFMRLDLLSDLNGYKLVVITVSNMLDSVVDYYLKNRNTKNIINGIVLVAPLTSLYSSRPMWPYPANYSEDGRRPNDRYGIYYNQSTQLTGIDWNLAGRGSMYEKFDIPLYLITDDDETNKPFSECYDKHNSQVFGRADSGGKFFIGANDVLCGMQLGLEMYGAVSSEVCIRRSVIQHTVEINSFCDPIGGSTYFSFLSNKPSNQREMMIISARLDTFTIYEYYTPAANEPISSIIGLLSLADILSQSSFRNETPNNKDVLFVLFDNEAFDYGGSSKFANDLVKNEFPSISITNSNKENGTDTFQLSKDYYFSKFALLISLLL